MSPQPNQAAKSGVPSACGAGDSIKPGVERSGTPGSSPRVSENCDDQNQDRVSRIYTFGLCSRADLGSELREVSKTKVRRPKSNSFKEQSCRVQQHSNRHHSYFS